MQHSNSDLQKVKQQVKHLWVCFAVVSDRRYWLHSSQIIVSTESFYGNIELSLKNIYLGNAPNIT